MTISKIQTLLPLDRYASIMRIDPVHFSGCPGIELGNGNTIHGMQNAQELVWPQKDWNVANQIGRDTIAQLISDAEHEIIDFLGYFPTPAWTEGESHTLTPFRNHSAGVYSTSFQLDMLKFISGGRRRSVVVDEDAPVNSLDNNSDGFSETRTVSVPTPTYPLEQLKVYFAGYDGDPLYEIRPPRTKKIVGANVVFTFDVWQLIDPELIENEPGFDPRGINIDDPDSIVTEVDVYREYNDNTQNAVETYTEDGSTVGGYITPSDNQSYIRAIPGSYNISTASWDSVTICDNVLYSAFWYYSGEKLPKNQYCKNHDDYMSPYIAKAISHLASSRLERGYAALNNVVSLIEDLRMDFTSPDADNVNVPFDLGDCPFGTRKGEYLVWKMIKNFQQRRFNSATI